MDSTARDIQAWEYVPLGPFLGKCFAKEEERDRRKTKVFNMSEKDDKKLEEGTSKIKEIRSTTHFQCSMLKGANYTTWAIRMQVILEANGLWEMIKPNLTTETVKEVWDALKKRHVKENRVQQAKQQTLKSEFEMLQMKENESVDSFTTKLTTKEEERDRRKTKVFNMSEKDDKKLEEGTSKIKEIRSTTHFQCSMLKGANYTTWAIRMQVILEANGLWEMIKPNLTTETVKEVWDALKKRHVKENRVQQAKQQTLKSEFEMLQMKENESVDSFTTKLTSIVNKAASLGLTYKDSIVKENLLEKVVENKTRTIINLKGKNGRLLKKIQETNLKSHVTDVTNLDTMPMNVQTNARIKSENSPILLKKT
ncbi:zinc finger, CCHC-type containing protein [Tanacetum coccineum]